MDTLIFALKRWHLLLVKVHTLIKAQGQEINLYKKIASFES